MLMCEYYHFVMERRGIFIKVIFSPTMSATLEFFKYAGAKQLPTQFLSALLDHWEKEGFELKGVLRRRGKRSLRFVFFLETNVTLWIGSHTHHYDWEGAQGENPPAIEPCSKC